ncbi:Uncharacterized protein FWK35_00001779, partial [Aphis craccivora]
SDILERSKLICFCDGTFKIACPLFAQVYVIVAKDIGGVHPLIYALLPNKQAKTFDLISNYNNNADFALSVKMITALAFVKIEDVDKAIKKWTQISTFPPTLWNVHDRVINGQVHTNNYAEASNRRLNTEMGQSSNIVVVHFKSA